MCILNALYHQPTRQLKKHPNHRTNASLSKELFFFVLRFFPGIDETKLFPVDLMHAEGDGMLGEESFQCFHVLIKIRNYFTLHEVNTIIKRAPTELWTDGVPVRPIHSSVCKGVKIQSGMRMRWTAAETHKFALASEALFDEHIPAEEPVWRCWKLHVQYLRIMLQDSFTAQDITLMDKLIFDHQTLYREVSHSVHTSLSRKRVIVL